MSLQDTRISEDHRITRIAEMLISEEMQLVRQELEMLRADLNRSYEIQREELQEFYLDAMLAIKGKGAMKLQALSSGLVKRDLSGDQLASTPEYIITARGRC
jgi:hypothetical protein